MTRSIPCRGISSAPAILVGVYPPDQSAHRYRIEMMTRNPTLLLAALLLLLPLLVAAEPSIRDLMLQEKNLNKGKAIDASLVLKDADGKRRVLVDELRGPLTVVGVSRGCAPCEQMLEHLRSAPAPADGRTMVVVQYESLEPIRGLPAHVKVFYTPAPSKAPGILQTSLTPTTFFFSARLVLLGRRNAFFGTAERTLAPPSEAPP
jgi:hypothetical protein